MLTYARVDPFWHIAASIQAVLHFTRNKVIERYHVVFTTSQPESWSFRGASERGIPTLQSSQ